MTFQWPGNGALLSFRDSSLVASQFSHLVGPSFLGLALGLPFLGAISSFPTVPEPRPLKFSQKSGHSGRLLGLRSVAIFFSRCHLPRGRSEPSDCWKCFGSLFVLGQRFGKILPLPALVPHGSSASPTPVVPSTNDGRCSISVHKGQRKFFR